MKYFPPFLPKFITRVLLPALFMCSVQTIHCMKAPKSSGEDAKTLTQKFQETSMYKGGKYLKDSAVRAGTRIKEGVVATPSQIKKTWEWGKQRPRASYEWLKKILGKKNDEGIGEKQGGDSFTPIEYEKSAEETIAEYDAKRREERDVARKRVEKREGELRENQEAQEQLKQRYSGEDLKRDSKYKSADLSTDESKLMVAYAKKELDALNKKIEHVEAFTKMKSQVEDLEMFVNEQKELIAYLKKLEDKTEDENRYLTLLEDDLKEKKYALQRAKEQVEELSRTFKQ